MIGRHVAWPNRPILVKKVGPVKISRPAHIRPTCVRSIQAHGPYEMCQFGPSTARERFDTIATHRQFEPVNSPLYIWAQYRPDEISAC